MITCDPLTPFTRYKCRCCGRIWYEPDKTGMLARVSGVLCDECRQQLFNPIRSLGLIVFCFF